MISTLRRLVPGDEAALESFLLPHAASSMFLRSNARQAGLRDDGRPLQMTYMAAFEDERMVGVAAHGWNGIVLVQVPDVRLVPSLVHAAVAATGRRVAGFSGPHAQVVAARAALGMAHAPATVDSREDLFTLALDELVLPPALADGTWLCRAPRPDERARLGDWRAEYHVEALGMAPGPTIEAVRQQFQIDDVQRVLIVDGELVSFCTFNAQLPDVVQVGGVFTPPAARGRGYARAVVAGLLRDARARGVGRALLFTGEENVAARRAYLALGFRVIGDYGLVLLKS